MPGNSWYPGARECRNNRPLAAPRKNPEPVDVKQNEGTECGIARKVTMGNRQIQKIKETEVNKQMHR